jgi:hypothetical protein
MPAGRQVKREFKSFPSVGTAILAGQNQYSNRLGEKY